MTDIVQRLRDFADPSKSRDAWDTDDMAIDAANEIAHLRERVAELEAEVKQLETQHFYWDDNNLESCYESINEAVEFLDVGDVVELRPIHELPRIWVRVGEDEHVVYQSREAAEAAGGDEPRKQALPPT